MAEDNELLKKFAELESRISALETENAELRHNLDSRITDIEDGDADASNVDGPLAGEFSPASPVLPPEPESWSEPYAYEVRIMSNKVYCLLPNDWFGTFDEASDPGSVALDVFGGPFGSSRYGSTKAMPSHSVEDAPHPVKSVGGSTRSPGTGTPKSFWSWQAVGDAPDSQSSGAKIVVATFRRDPHVSTLPPPRPDTSTFGQDGPWLEQISLMSVSEWQSACRGTWKNPDRKRFRFPVAAVADGRVVQMLLGVPGGAGDLVATPDGDDTHGYYTGHPEWYSIFTANVPASPYQASRHDYGELQLWHFARDVSDGTISFNPNVTRENDKINVDVTVSVPTSFGGNVRSGNVYICSKVVDSHGCAELKWLDVSSYFTYELEYPDYTGYSELSQWYHDYLDESDDVPSGMTYPIIIPDPNNPGAWTWIDLDDLSYWKCGGDETECYGRAIGDSNNAKTIDLDNKSLVGAWSCGSDFSASGDLTTTGNLYVGGGNIYIGNDVYAPTQISVGGQTYTVLAKVQP